MEILFFEYDSQLSEQYDLCSNELHSVSKLQFFLRENNLSTEGEA